MSVVSSRPRVRGASLTTAGASVALTAGATLAGLLLRSVGAAARVAYREGGKAREALRNDAAVESVAAIDARQRRDAAARSGALQGLPPGEALKVETALLLSDYGAADPDALRPRMSELASSRSLAEAREARRGLLEAARTQHQALLIAQVTEACIRASRTAGFGTVEARRRGGQVRVIATNRSGQALVTEIDGTEGGDLSLATEAVGVRDGSCHGLLDRFDAALEAEGVIAGRPRRSPTGGVCQLETAREALRQLYRASRKPLEPTRLRPDELADEHSDSTMDRRRARTRLNRQWSAS